MYIGKFKIVQQRTADGPLCHVGFVRHMCFKYQTIFNPFEPVGSGRIGCHAWSGAKARCNPMMNPNLGRFTNPFWGLALGV